MGKFVVVILTCFILNHGIAGVQSDSETDKTSDGESKKGLDDLDGKSKSESKNELGKKFEGESEEKEKSSAKNEDAGAEKDNLVEKKPESKNEKSSGKEADGGKGEGAEKSDKGKAGHGAASVRKHAPQKALHRQPGTASPDVENMIHEEASRVRGEELEQTEGERNPDMEKPNSMTPEEAAEKAKKKAEEDAQQAEAAAKEAADAKTTMSPEEEQNNGEMEKEVMEQSARERGKELAETEEDREKNHEPAVDFSKMEKNVEKDTEKKDDNDKSKPEKEEKEESEKSGDSPKEEKTVSKDEEKPSPGKSGQNRWDDKPLFGRNEQESGKAESQNEGSSFRDTKKGKFGKFESGKDDRKAKTFQSDRDRDRDESEMENAFMEEGERAKREKKAPANKTHKENPHEKKKHKAAEAVEAKKKESKEHHPKTAKQKSETGETGAETTSTEDDQTISTESRSVSQCITNDLPQELRDKIQETNDAEDLVLSSYVTSEQVPFKIIHGYQTAKGAERTFLKELLPELGPEADSVLAAYRALRKGAAWNYVAHDERYKKFFRKPSTALTLYQTLKADENNTLDSFLASDTPVQTFNESVNARSVQTVDLKKRSFAGDSAAASAKRERSGGEVLHRGISATGVESMMDDSEVMDGAKDRHDTSEKTIQVPDDDESSSEEATTKFADKQTVNFKSNLVKCLILFSVIAQMIVVFIIVIACRMEVVKWNEKQKKTHHDKDTKPSHGYSRIEDDDETDTKEESANFSISVTTLGGADHHQP